ncbi:unnamed protein product, partial [Effrenium voratum]
GVCSAGGRIAAVGASSRAKAQDLAEKVKATKAHGSYEDLVADDEVDVIYVGTIHTMHAPHTKLALNAGKHVVCEKPLAVNAAEAKELVELARSKGLFLMEAMWTRFFPAIRKAREILDSGVLGTVCNVQADFGFVGPSDPGHRLLDPQVAGGGMLDIGCYLVQAATMAFGPSMPSVKGSAVLTEKGVDLEGALTLGFEQGSANLFYSLRAPTPENTVVQCTKGYMRLHGPAHTPTKLTVHKAGERGSFSEERHEFVLPPLPQGLSVNYPRSEGMKYQVEAAEML